MASKRMTIMGTRHVVAAGHYLAAHAAFEILEAGGNAIDLAGRSGSAEQVPQYLQKLSGEQAFKGRTFGGLALRVEETGVSFRLGSSSLASESAGEP